MSHITIGDEQTDEAILNYDVSDTALETAAGTGKQNAGAITLPSALICIPFVAQRAGRVLNL
jgi:hypothetical protein